MKDQELYILPGPFFSSICRNRSRSLRSLSRQAVTMMKRTSMPTMPNRAVKIVSRKTLAKDEIGVTQPRMSAAAPWLEHVASVTKKGGDVLLKYPQHEN